LFVILRLKIEFLEIRFKILFYYFFPINILILT